jgi:predicted ArsR family transcriptional regulator
MTSTSGAEGQADPIATVAALSDQVRRELHEFVRRAKGPVTREDAAAAVGISRKLAAFHLDKLVGAGLLAARTKAAGGIRKVGRAPKLYEPADVDIRVAIPPRRHDLLADILLEAVLTEGRDEDARGAALRAAAQRGEQLGAEERRRIRPGKLGAERALTYAETVLARYGFEPARTDPACLRLRNCPFHPMAERSPALVCGLNQAFLQGFLHGLHATTVRADLAPEAGHCCVQLRRTTPQT